MLPKQINKRTTGSHSCECLKRRSTLALDSQLTTLIAAYGPPDNGLAIGYLAREGANLRQGGVGWLVRIESVTRKNFALVSSRIEGEGVEERGNE